MLKSEKRYIHAISSHLIFRGILPDLKIMIRETVGSDYLLVFRVPKYARNLALGVDRVNALSNVDVPKLNSPVVGTATGC